MDSPGKRQILETYEADIRQLEHSAEVAESLIADLPHEREWLTKMSTHWRATVELIKENADYVRKNW